MEPPFAVGTLEFRSITEPIKNSFRDVEYIQAECTAIDPVARLDWECQGSFYLPIVEACTVLFTCAGPWL